MKDYYTILGISKTATEDEIKKAYRKLAHQYHPDKPGGDEQKFKEINEAYQVLSDKVKRAQYDRFGTADPMGGFGGGAQWGGFGNGGFEGFGGFDPSQFADMGDMGDIFESFFEGIGMRPRRKTYEKGADLEIQEQITLEEAFRGAKRNLKIRTFVQCAKCSGKGAEPGSAFEKCSVCAGQGEVREQRRTFFGSFSQVKACGTCHGSGEVPTKPCSTCKGVGRVEADRDVAFDILPGIEDGQLIKLQSMGEAGERGTASGDLYVRVRVKPHPVFERQGNDLIVLRELKVLDLLLGKKIEVPTIAGGKISAEIPPSFNLKDYLRVTGEGMPRFGSRSGARGDLLINFIIKAPKKPGGKTKKLLEELEKEE